jgi:hypothetical protein
VGYRLLTTLILTAHFGYLAYLVFGGFLAWRWPRAIWSHLVAAAWGGTIVVADLLGGGLTCPLTYAEDWSRRRAGEAGLTAGFIDRYIEGVLYPDRYAVAAQTLAAAAVAASWLGYAQRRRRERAVSTPPPRRDRCARPIGAPSGIRHAGDPRVCDAHIWDPHACDLRCQGPYRRG